MALSVLGLNSTEPIIIENAQAINKSYPTFFEDFEKLCVSSK